MESVRDPRKEATS